MKKIVMTGGGTAGHVTPNIALFPALKEQGYDIEYIGSYNGIEKKLITAQNIKYHGISSGKLRRYFSWQNFIDPFRVIKGFFEAKKLIKELQPDVLFSKGGFVSVPVVLAAHKNKIPIVIHESDITPGLANKVAARYAKKICHTFPETGSHLGKRAVYTGTPIREELYHGDAEVARKMCGFTDSKPVVLVMGGSLGSKAINDALRMALPDLLEEYNIAHLCGKGKLDNSIKDLAGYAQFEYVSGEMKDFLEMADLVISRAGSNSICEFAALLKPNILIPLPAASSRGDQILNAASFEKQGFSEVIDEEILTSTLLLTSIKKVLNNRDRYVDAMKSAKMSGAIEKIVATINSCSN